MGTKKRVILVSLLVMVFIFSKGFAALGDKEILLSDYFPTEPGHYVKYSMSDGYNRLKNCRVEMVFQNSVGDTFLTTLTQIGTSSGYFCNSVMSGKEEFGRLRYFSGSLGNQAHFIFTLFNVPVKLRDGDTWRHQSTVYSISKVAEIRIDSTVYRDCLKIKVDNSESENEFLRGTGSIYLSKGIGIVKYEFNRENRKRFIAEIIDSGNLPARTISGRVTLDGEKPAEGYIVALNNARCEIGINAARVDSEGKFSLQVYGHSIVLKCGPPIDRGLDYEKTRGCKLEGITADVSGLELNMRLLAEETLIKIPRLTLKFEEKNHCR